MNVIHSAIRAIDEQMEALGKAKSALASINGNSSNPKSHRRLSPKALQSIRKAQLKRWAKWRKTRKAA